MSTAHRDDPDLSDLGKDGCSGIRLCDHSKPATKGYGQQRYQFHESVELTTLSELCVCKQTDLAHPIEIDVDKLTQRSRTKTSAPSSPNSRA